MGLLWILLIAFIGSSIGDINTKGTNCDTTDILSRDILKIKLKT